MLYHSSHLLNLPGCENSHKIENWREKLLFRLKLPLDLLNPASESNIIPAP